MKKETLSGKILVLGVDGMDPSLTKKFLTTGKMPHLQKIIKQGSAREDLVLLGAMPTVTPPMWTTLATGAYPYSHGITAFFRQDKENLATTCYNLDSRLCKAEPLWNVFCEAGKKTLVWHWPGSSWPPTSDSELLHVVDGTQPSAINMGHALADWEQIGIASEDISEVNYIPRDKSDKGAAGCVITDLDEMEDSSSTAGDAFLSGAGSQTLLVTDESLTEINILGNFACNKVMSPIKKAEGWSFDVKEAKEFSILVGNGYTKRYGLILKNEKGIYDRVAIYKNKKETEPLFIAKTGEHTPNYVDEINVDGEKKKVCRHMTILELSEDGSKIRYHLGLAMEINNSSVWHPASLLNEINQNVGYVPATTTLPAKNPEYVEKIMIHAWDNYCDWQADCLNYLIDNDGYEVVFSHLHNIDSVGHLLWHYGKHRDEWGNDEKFYQGIMQYIYEQTDRYLGKFEKYLSEEWTIFIVSDHGLMTEENHPPILAESTISVPVMQELGYTVLKKDEYGNDIAEIDWSKTKAIAARCGHIYLNLKERHDYGIVTENERYDLEAQIISDLYNYRDPHTGKRIVALALRNRDAHILGMGGEECGDIVFFMEEGFNIIHADSMSTQRGYWDTSVSPIFIAAGQGIKKDYTIKKIIRQVDIAPTLATIGGVRLPANNDGAIISQILTEEV